MEKTLILLRGLPGAGKTTLANSITLTGGGRLFEADMYFEHPIRGYVFEPALIKDAHEWCYTAVENAIQRVHNRGDMTDRIIVSNTFTQEWEMDRYIKLGSKYHYRIYTLIVENRHDGVNTHNVPQETIEKMRNRFEIKL